MDLENKILGLEEAPKEKPVVKANYLAEHCVWEVSKKECGKSIFTGVMVREMLDDNAKKIIMNGKKDLEYNGFRFKLVK